MNKSRLAELIVNPSSCTHEEARELNELAIQFPYSSALHILNAKIAASRKSESKEALLTRAAIATSDRMRLKQYITSDEIFRNYELASENVTDNNNNEAPVDEVPVETETAEIREEVIIESEITEPVEANRNESLSEEETVTENENETLIETETEIELKEAENKEEIPEKGISTESVAEEKLQEEMPKAVIHDIDRESIPRDVDRKSPLAEELMENLATYRELREKFESLFPEEFPGESGEPKTEKIDNDLTHVDEKFKEIIKPIQKKKSSKKLAKEEQDQLINKFIETDSDKTKPAKTGGDKKQPAEDLSLQSGELNEEMVTETLANILVNQGKLEKAIDIYRKLIWKLPQKKAYFASKIESLKERLSK